MYSTIQTVDKFGITLNQAERLASFLGLDNRQTKSRRARLSSEPTFVVVLTHHDGEEEDVRAVVVASRVPQTGHLGMGEPAAIGMLELNDEEYYFLITSSMELGDKLISGNGDEPEELLARPHLFYNVE